MRKNFLLWGILVTGGLILGLLPTWASAAPSLQEPGQNLLKNPGFEGLSCNPASPPGWCYDNWTRDTYTGVPYGEIYTPQGWVTFWSEGTNPADGRKYGRPECKVIPRQPPFLGPPARIRSGNYAIMQFGFYRSIDSGVYQVVTGLTPHAIVQASAYAHAWTCNDDEHGPYSCGEQYQMRFRVGIDPNGGTNPWSPSVIWAEGYSYDEYRLIGPVQAEVGDAGTVTVFLRATAKWPLEHNDTYWDDASLIYTTPPATSTNTPLPPPPTNTPGPSPTPLPTPTPRPDGCSVHIVQQGETLFGIALRYGVEMDQILRFNNIPNPSLIQTGQELVISCPLETPTPLPSPTPLATPTPETGSVCVLAYHDRNGDTFRQQDTEEMLPNAVFSLGDVSGLLGQYTTDGLSEPYCFTGLTPGTYRVTMQPPPGYVPSGPSDMALALGTAGTLDVVLGAQRGQVTETPESSPAEPEGEGTRLVSSQVWRWVARISGILVLVLAIAVAVLFVLSRRQR